MPTVRDCFSEALPFDFQFRTEDSPDAHISGESTQNATPAGFGITVPFDSWRYYSNAVLEDNRIDPSAHVAPWDPSIRLQVEADVSEAACLYLTNPVNIALSSKRDRNFTSLNQFTHAQVRCDKAWARVEDNEEYCFAIMEYKRFGTIRPAELREAVVGSERFGVTLNRYNVNGGRSLFEENSRILVQQAVNYGHRYGTRYIAFYDGNILFLLYLINLEDSHGGDWCYCTVIEDSRRMRRALLGFLERAYRASVYGDENLSEIMTPDVRPNSDAARGGGDGGGSNSSRSNRRRR